MKRESTKGQRALVSKRWVITSLGNRSLPSKKFKLSSRESLMSTEPRILSPKRIYFLEIGKERRKKWSTSKTKMISQI